MATKWVIVTTMHDGSQEAFGPFSSDTVHEQCERAKELNWYEHATYITLASPTEFKSGYNHAKSIGRTTTNGDSA